VKNLIFVIMCSCLIWLLASCSSKPVTTDNGGRQVIKSVSCIAVLPALAGESEEAPQQEELASQDLRNGAAFADTVLHQQIAAKPEVHMVSGEPIGNLASTITSTGASTGCDAVMTTTVYTFRQRQGTEYAVDEPASAAFDMRIYDVASRQVLWAADFHETQEPLLSNILSFGKALGRGFKWITVEQLMAEGMKERLAECPYLQKQ